MPEVVCIIVNWNKPDLTLSCVRSLLRQKYQNFRVVVVDNGSEATQWTKLVHAVELLGGVVLVSPFKDSVQPNAKLVVVRRDANGGYAAGVNMGVTVASRVFPNARYFFVLNNDLEFSDPDLIARLVSVAQLHHNEVIVCPCILTQFHSHVRAERKIWTVKGVGKIVCNTGAAFFVPLEVFRRIGLMDELYFLYFEDTDFFERARRQGILCVPLRNSGIVHRLSSTTGGLLSPIALYYSTRNKIRFIKRNRFGMQKIVQLAYTLYFGALSRLALLLAHRRLDLLQYFVRGYVDGLLGKTGKGPTP